MNLSIARDFSDVPAGRYLADGDYSGQRFRDELLVPKLEKSTEKDPLIVDITDVEGYASSFLEEAFGGLVRKKVYSSEKLHKKLKIKSDGKYSIYETIIWEHIDEA